MKFIPAQKNTQRGIALLFVILLTSVLLLVAIGISNVSYRELTFSIEAQDSDRAFFAADTGIECGLYLFNQDVFSPTGIGTFTCSGISPTIIDSDPNYSFALPVGTNACTLVSVDKAFDGDGSGAGAYTKISSVGYNVAWNPSTPTVCISGTPGLRVVTRGLSLQFPNEIPEPTP